MHSSTLAGTLRHQRWRRRLRLLLEAGLPPFYQIWFIILLKHWETPGSWHQALVGMRLVVCILKGRMNEKWLQTERGEQKWKCMPTSWIYFCNRTVLIQEKTGMLSIAYFTCASFQNSMHSGFGVDAVFSHTFSSQTLKSLQVEKSNAQDLSGAWLSVSMFYCICTLQSTWALLSQTKFRHVPLSLYCCTVCSLVWDGMRAGVWT